MKRINIVTITEIITQLKNNNFDTDSEDDNSFITNSDYESDNSVDSAEYDNSSIDSSSNNDCSKEKWNKY